MNFYSALLSHAATLTKADILTYHALADLGGETYCTAWQDEIAAKAGVSPRQVASGLVQALLALEIEAEGVQSAHPSRND